MTTKICTQCRKRKPIIEFTYSCKTRRPWTECRCKACKRKYLKAYQAMNKPRLAVQRKTYATAQRKKRQAIVNKIKQDRGCIFCPESLPACCLDFHHVNPSIKDREISKLVNGCKLSRIDRELDKCVVICSNCHRKLHAGLLALPALELPS